MRGARVAVTGLGVVAPCGIGVDAFWDGINTPVEPADKRTVDDFDAGPWFENPKEARRTDRFAQFAMAAAQMALDQAGDIGADPDRSGVIIGTGVGGLTTLENGVQIYYTKGARRVSPFLVPMMMANAAAAAVSMRHGWRGPCETISTACAAGSHSIGYAAMLIASGRCDVMLGGSAEAALTPTAIQGFVNMTATSSSGRSCPFDGDRDGFVIAEGAGVVVLEDMDRAIARGATILAEVLGAASTADAHHITAPAPGGSGAVSCMEQALADAGVPTSAVGQINAHGTSTPLNDAAEAEAIAKVFGTPGPPVTSIKGVTGHSLGAAGALEAVASVLSIQKRLIPPTMGFETLDPDMPPIDVVAGEARPWDPAPLLSNSFGFGGHNGCLVFGPPPA